MVDDPNVVLGTGEIQEGQIGLVPPVESTQEGAPEPIETVEGGDLPVPVLAGDPFAEPPVDIFSGVTEPEERTPPSNPETTRRTAQLAAIATMGGASDEADGIMNSVMAETQAYYDQLERMGELAVRQEIAAGRKADRAAALENVLRDNLAVGGDDELAQGSLVAYTNLLQLDAAEDAQWALERQAVERIQSLAANGGVTQARLMMANLENGNALDVIRDYNTKQMILQSALDRAEIAQRDQPWFRDLADFALSIVPLYSPSRTGNVNVADAVRNWYDSLMAGGRFRRESEALWDMPVEDMAKFVNGDFLKNLHENATLFGYTNQSEMLELMSGLIERTPSAFETNAWSALDIAGAVPWTKAAKLGTGLTGMMVRTGARREASELTAKAALDIIQDSTGAAAKVGMTPEGVAGNLQVSAVAPEGSISKVPIAVDANTAMQRGRELLANLPDIEARARLQGTELQKAIDTAVARLERQFGREVKDVDPHSVNLADNTRTHRISFTLGKKNGGGFATKAQAERYLASIGERGGAIVDESGQWFARTTIDVNEMGFYSNVLNSRSPGIWRWLLNARNIGDINLANAGQTAGNARNRLLKTLVEPFGDTFRALRGGERDALSQVLQAGETTSTWFSKEQFDTLYQRRFNRAPSEREVKAYQAARDINDMEYVLRNDDAYKQRVIKGYRTGSLDTGLGQIDRANMIVDRELKSMPKTRIFDASTGRHFTRGDDAMTPTAWERLKGKGYVLVTTEQAVKLADGTTVKNFLVKGKDLTLENLRRDQIAYRAGGHRMYRGKYFVKQTVEGVQPDTGLKFLDNPNTYIAAETRAEADFWASRMEAARLAHLEGADLARLDEILGGHAGLPDAEEFVRLMDDVNGPFQKNTPFGTYFDREMPEDYMRNGAGLDFIDPDDTGFNGLLRTQGRMYTGRKGEQLTDYMGNLAPLLDPYETINRSLMNIASLSSFGDYKVQSVERWMNTFGKYLDKQDIGNDLSNMRLFMEAPLAKGGNDVTEKIRQAAEAQRAIIKRTLGWKTPNDLKADQWSRSLADFVAGSRVDGILPNARKALAVAWTQDTNPISALRSFAFDLKLGMFNVAQLPMQISTAVAATAMSPKLGMQGWSMIAPMRFMLGGKALSREAFEARLEQLAKNGVANLGGFKDKAEFKDFVRAATRSGFMDLGGTHGLMDHYGASAALDGFQSGVKRAREAGRFFFYEAERWNRIVAWRIAWGETVESGLKRNTPEFAAKLAGRAEEYAFNMSRESQAWWQKGLLSIPTQFWAYNARMLEAMTVGNFTPAQKMRLVASQSLLYGSAGLPITGFISDQIKGNSGQTPDIDSFWGTMDRGLIDRFIFETTGADVAVGERYGTGGWAAQMVENIFGVSAYGEVSAADILGGATFNIMGKVGTDVLRPVVEYMAAESGDTGTPIRRDSLIRMASNVSVVGNGLKAYMVFNYGTYVSGTGTTQVSDLPPQTAFAVALGIAPAEVDELKAMRSYFENKTEAVRDASRVIANYRVDMLNRPDQRESIQEEVNAFVRLLPEDIRREALEKAPTRVDPSMYASYVERMQREQIEAERNGQTD